MSNDQDVVFQSDRQSPLTEFILDQFKSCGQIDFEAFKENSRLIYVLRLHAAIYLICFILKELHCMCTLPSNTLDCPCMVPGVCVCV